MALLYHDHRILPEERVVLNGTGGRAGRRSGTSERTNDSIEEERKRLRRKSRNWRGRAGERERASAGSAGVRITAHLAAGSCAPSAAREILSDQARVRPTAKMSPFHSHRPSARPPGT